MLLRHGETISTAESVMRIAMLVPVVAVGLMAWVMTPASAQELITGTASFRERIALPPNAVFEAVLEDVSRADAPAVEIARTTIEGPGQPPIAFSIAFDRSAIDERLTYAVRTRIRVGERLIFTSDTLHRVLTRKAPSEVTVMMRMVSGRTETPGRIRVLSNPSASVSSSAECSSTWRMPPG